jgi:Methyltransferase domain
MLKSVLKRIASSTSHNSLAASLRKKRFKYFLKIIEQIDKKNITILDVGGWEKYWEIQEFTDKSHQIILLNSEKVKTNYSTISSVSGNALNMSEFSDQSIDVVFSNSVIEHLGTFENQLKMANEVKRIGKMYYIQTPSFYFPLEPHFLFPFFHWLPFSLRIFLVRHFSLGYFEKQKNTQDAERLVKEHHLLKKREFRSLFPDGLIITEKFFGFTKSYIAIKSY